MRADEDSSADKKGVNELTREEAREKSDYFLALTKKSTNRKDEIDSADSTMAILILPGG